VEVLLDRLGLTACRAIGPARNIGNQASVVDQDHLRKVLVITALVAIGAAIQYITTINQPFTPAK
jgi:hypothetical protein